MLEKSRKPLACLSIFENIQFNYILDIPMKINCRVKRRLVPILMHGNPRKQMSMVNMKNSLSIKARWTPHEIVSNIY